MYIHYLCDTQPLNASMGCGAMVNFEDTKRSSAAGTRTRVARVRAEYPNQLDYSGLVIWPFRFFQCGGLAGDVYTPRRRNLQN